MTLACILRNPYDCLLLLAISATLMGIACTEDDMAQSSPNDDVVLKSGELNCAEVFAQLGPSGKREYRMVYTPSGRRLPLAEQGGHYSTISDLVAAIRATTETQVVATDPMLPDSWWLIGDAKVEPLTNAEIVKIKSLLGK